MQSPADNRQVFLCYAREDFPHVMEVYKLLQNAGLDPWLDKEDLLPGQRWRQEIPRAIREAAVILVFLSTTSVNKRGYVQREFKLALDTVQEIPYGDVYLIPVKLDECDVPDVFGEFQWSALYEPDGATRILESIARQLERASLAGRDAHGQRSSISRATPAPSMHQGDLGVRDRLYAEAMNGRKAGTRQHAIRSLVRTFGVTSADWLQELAWSSRYSAARCEAVEQVTSLRGHDALDWLKEVAERHPDKACRARAAGLVIRFLGVQACAWFEGLLAGERDWLVTYAVGHAFYRSVQSTGGADQGGRDAAITTLRRILQRPIEDDPRECLLAASLTLAQDNEATRVWALSTALETAAKWSRAKCLTIVLRRWPDTAEAIDALRALSTGSEDTVAKEHARVYLKWILEENWRSIDDLLGLGKRFE